MVGVAGLLQLSRWWRRRNSGTSGQQLALREDEDIRTADGGEHPGERAGESAVVGTAARGSATAPGRGAGADGAAKPKREGGAK